MMNGEGRPHGGPRQQPYIAGRDFTRSRRRTAAAGRPLVYLRRVPIGELHPWGRCSDCGTNAAPLRRSTHIATKAPAYLCEDTITCLRRQERANRVH